MGQENEDRVIMHHGSGGVDGQSVRLCGWTSLARCEVCDIGRDAGKTDDDSPRDKKDWSAHGKVCGVDAVSA